MAKDTLPTKEVNHEWNYEIVVQVPGIRTWGRTSVRESYEREAKDLEDKLHQLSGYENVTVDVIYTGEEVCKYCEYEPEVDDDGLPVCCQEAREHMTAQAVAGEEID